MIKRLSDCAIKGTALLVLLLVAQTAQAVERKLWVGKGETNKASEAANWRPDGAPQGGERLLFGHSSVKDCEWDYDVWVTSITMARGYSGRVSVGTHRLEVSRHVRVAGGVLDLADGQLLVHGLLYMDWGGSVQLSQGELRLGRSGLLVDNGGTLLSTGDKPAKIASATGEHYDFRVGKGNVNISNKAGTLVERSKGIVLYSKAKVEKAANVAVKEVPQGATAVTVFPAKAGAAAAPEVVLEEWTFDESVGKKVESPGAPAEAAPVKLVEKAPPPIETETVAAPPDQPLPEEKEEEAAPPAGKGLSMAELTKDDDRVKITPLFNLQILGGQYFFKGQKGNLSGNASFLAAPAIKFSETWSLLPTYSMGYQGTKQVVDLVGAGSLFQQRMTHRLGARGVYRPGGEGPWRIKPGVSARWELLEETKDEEWGSGLFDSQKLGAGVEAEYVYREPFSVRASYDYAQTRYPNYSTLESQQTFDFNGQPLARELVGGHTLDNTAHSFTLAGSAQAGKALIVEPTYVLLLQKYPVQRIVNASGAFDASVRRDTTQLLDVTVRHPRQVRDGLKFLANLSLGATFARSNQNSYDALNTRFIGGYYDYDEMALRPSVTVLLGGSKTEKPLAANLGLTVTDRAYSSRPTQNAAGAYQASKIRQVNTAVSATVSVPMDSEFSLTANLQYGSASSNQGFQQFYKYDYSTINYLFGVSWQY